MVPSQWFRILPLTNTCQPIFCSQGAGTASAVPRVLDNELLVGLWLIVSQSVVG